MYGNVCDEIELSESHYIPLTSAFTCSFRFVIHVRCHVISYRRRLKNWTGKRSPSTCIASSYRCNELFFSSFNASSRHLSNSWTRCRSSLCCCILCLDHSFKSKVLLSFSSGVNSTEFRCLDASKSAVFNNDSGLIGGTISVLRMLNTGVFFFLTTNGHFPLLRAGLCLAGKDCRMARPFTERRTTTFSSACRSPCWFFNLVPRVSRSLKIKTT